VIDGSSPLNCERIPKGLLSRIILGNLIPTCRRLDGGGEIA